MTTEEAGKYLAISKYTLREAVKQRALPFYTPPGKGYYFLKDDLDAWMESYRIDCVHDVGKEEVESQVDDIEDDGMDIQAQFEALKKRRGI